MFRTKIQITCAFLLFFGLACKQSTLIHSNVPGGPHVNVQNSGAIDLRFKGMGTPYVVSATAFHGSNLLGNGGQTYQNNQGLPLDVSNANCVSDPTNPNSFTECAWDVTTGPGIPGLITSYLSASMNSFGTEVAANASLSNTLIVGLNTVAANHAFAMSTYSINQKGNFTQTSATVPALDLSTEVAREAAAGSVVTAVSLDGAGNANYVAYGWDQSPTAVYDTAVVTAVGADKAVSAATTLAAQGFMITAFGGDSAGTLVMVGTRVKGNSSPLAFAAYTSTAHHDPGTLLKQGYTVIGIVGNYTGPASAPQVTLTWLGEK